MHIPDQLDADQHEQLYKMGVKTFYKKLSGDTPQNLSQTHALSQRALPEKRGEAFAFLTGELRSNLEEVSDRYVTAQAERTRFLGFRVLEHTSLERRVMVPDIPLPHDRRRQTYEQSLQQHPCARAATVSDMAPWLLGMNSTHFIAKDDIHLNREQENAVRILTQEMQSVRSRILRTMQMLDKRLCWPRRWLPWNKTESARTRIDETAAVYRRYRDWGCQLESAQYALGMGKQMDPWRKDELETSYIQALQMISLIEYEASQ
jgi:hypothetical protein